MSRAPKPVNVAIGDALVAHLRAEPHATASELMKKLGAPYHVIYGQLARLERERLVLRAKRPDGLFHWQALGEAPEMPPMVVTDPGDKR